MKKLLLVAGIAVGAFVVAACETVKTPYQKAGSGSDKAGYEEVQLGDNVFEVSFSGEAGGRKGEVMDLALLRCAELTLERGYRFFVVSDSHQEDISTFADVLWLGPRSQTRYEIVMHQLKPDTEMVVYDAAITVKSIKGKMQRQSAPAPPAT